MWACRDGVIPMQILFIHQSFPGQFKFVAPALARRGHAVTALFLSNKPAGTWQGVRMVPYQVARSTSRSIHPWVRDFESKVIRAEACFRAALALKAQGYEPDVVMAHPGWGESLFIKDVWPQARLAIYCEFFYRHEGADVGFDPEFQQTGPGGVCRLRLKNLNNFMHFETADAAISPTHWQASTFPSPFRDQIRVVHDGIDTGHLCPNPDARLNLKTQQGETLVLSRQDEILTFVNRNLEPQRGYHIFMRALPDLLRQRPGLKVLIVGGNGVGYGAAPDPEKYGERGWKDIFIDEIKPKMTPESWRRVHFLGNIAYPQFVSLLQLSRVHVYLTYPFVLSWSLLEAMSVGCAIVASDTAPVKEVIRHGETGSLVPFFDVEGLVQEVCGLLSDPQRAQRYGAAARAFVQAHCDLQTVCLPAQLAWLEALAKLPAR